MKKIARTIKNNPYPWLLGLVIAATAIFYLPLWQAGFLHWDEYVHILNNPHVQNMNIKALFTSYYLGMWQPITEFSFALDWQLFGNNPAAFHAVSLFWHLLNVVLVYTLTQTLFKKPLISLITAALFALHPLHVESVAWISARSALLYTFFMLLALLAYRVYVQQRKISFYFVTLVLFALSILSKPAAAVLPLLLLLMDWFWQRKWNLKIFLEKTPFFLLSLAGGLITIAARKAENHFNVSFVSHYDWYDVIFFIPTGIIEYLRQMLMPINMTWNYPLPVKESGLLPWFYYFSFIAFLALLYFVIKTKRRRRFFLFSFLFYTVSLLLMLKFTSVATSITADRYAYLSSIAFFWILAFLFTKLVQKLPRLKKVIITSLISILIIFGFITYLQSQIWKSDITLLNHAIGYAPEHPSRGILYSNRGYTYLQKGQLKPAIENFLKSIELNPELAQSYDNLAIIYSDYLNNHQKAIEYHNLAIKTKPRAQFFYNRANTRINIGEWEKALADLNAAINSPEKYFRYQEYDPMAAYFNRGLLLLRLNRPQEAIADLDVVLNQFSPDLAAAYFNRGLAKIQLNHSDEACQDLDKAVKLNFSPAREKYNEYCVK